ncbi:hypothetical protein SAMN05443574_10190 [Haloarcula vallismortis]|uniref:Uncharacterized protein n=3 Tax=Haloarcula vallismortis TaxID=28442 RepID=M0IYZ6_HALVA|nr:hypothetical protein C437_17757 [Haloarcula vallismortis ATCC 29715]SDW02696.1 hypothetical protein SAMN05443574_10190 [Haloarcula vallismortis]
MLGTAGVAVAGTGLGSIAFSGNSAAATVDIGATNPGSVTNDRGDLSKVTIDPTFRVEWSDLDTAVGKVFYVIEGRTRDNGNWSDWSPVFRSTPWLTPGSLQGADASKPGTSGHLEFSDPLSAIMNRSSASRDNDNPSPGFGSTGKAEDPRPLPRPIEVVNELGRPDYENADYSDINGVDASSYLAGNSMGGANSAYSNLDSGELSRTEGGAVEYGDSSLDDNGGTLPLVNNFPGAESGYYGAADDTSRFDVDEDGASDTDTVEIRYTFALQRLNTGSANLGDDPSGIGYTPVSSFTQNPLSDYSTIEEAVREDPHLENVRPEDVNTGNSELVMDGTDDYPSITNNGANSAASNVYDAYQAIADSHPAVISTTAQFTVTVTNEAGDSGVTGDTSAGASGGGQ